MDQTVIIMTLPQVIDAALTGPEMGIVSYTLLNNILQVMCQQLNLENVKMQYQGSQANQIKSIWNPDVKSRLPQVTAFKKTIAESIDAKEEETIMVIPDGPSENYPAMTLTITNTQLKDMDNSIRSLQQEVSDLRALPSNNDLLKALKPKTGQPSPIVDMYQLLSVTKRMDATEEAVTKIASFVEDLAKTIQSESHPSGLGQDFESKSPELGGSGVLKDKTGGSGILKNKTRGSGTLSNKTGDSDLREPPAHQFDIATEKDKKHSDFVMQDGSTSNVKNVRKSLSGVSCVCDPKTPDLGSPKNLSITQKLDPTATVIRESIGGGGSTDKKQKDRLSIKPDAKQSTGLKMDTGIVIPECKLLHIKGNISSTHLMEIIQEEVKNLRVIVEYLCGKLESGGHTHFGAGILPKTHQSQPHTQPYDQKVTQIEAKVHQCINQINKIDSIFSTSYSGLTNRIADMESSVKVLSNKVLQDVGKADLEEQMLQNISIINDKVLGLEGIATKQQEAVSLLLEEDNSKQNKIMNILDDIDSLKSDKVGREEFGDALSEKVDICMINRKVSHDQFNATCDDLSKGIEEALERLMEQFIFDEAENARQAADNVNRNFDVKGAPRTGRPIVDKIMDIVESDLHEDLWHVALKEIQDEINDKLGKDDLSPLKEFVVDKLKGLQQKVKTLAKIKREQEAAATKSKFLKNVQCISCDQEVIMRKKLDEAVNYPGAPVFPPHKNIAPYLAYELDQLRRQQRQVQYGRNLHHFESATREQKGVVNRYCGGAHTITTPQQRVTRVGNFEEQWGPKVVRVEKEKFQCQSDRNSSQKSSRASISVKVNSAIKFELAEKDEGNQAPRKSSDKTVTVQENKENGEIEQKKVE